MNPTFTCKLDLDSDSATFGKYVLTDTTDWVAEGYTLANITGIFNVTDPLGEYRTGSFSSPDTDGSVPDLVFDTLVIRQNSENGYLLGTYSVEYQAKDSASGDTFTATLTFEVDPPEEVINSLGLIQDGSVVHTINPFSLVLTITDETEHGAYTTRARTMYLDPPEFTALPQVTNAGPTLTYNFTWVNTAYSLLVDTLLTYVTGNFTLSVRLKYQEAITVQVPQNIAAVYQCYVRYCEQYLIKAKCHGGISNLPAVDRDDHAYIISLFQKMEAAAKISNFTVVEETILAITDALNRYVPCDCSCDTTQAAELANPWDGVTPTSYTFAGTYPVEVNTVGTTITYSLNAAWVASLVTITDDITAIDESIEIASVTSGGVKTWNLSTRQHCGFLATLAYSTGPNISVTISGAYSQGTRYVDLNDTWKTGNNVQVEGYPFGTIGDLEAAWAVFFIKDFLTTPATPTDKVFVEEVQILNAGASGSTDYGQPCKYRIEKYGVASNKIRFRIVNAATGVPVTMSEFVEDIGSMVISVKINE